MPKAKYEVACLMAANVPCGISACHFSRLIQLSVTLLPHQSTDLHQTILRDIKDSSVGRDDASGM